ncbi:MAG TPA: ABC transporter substrate-binding protein, partial [Acidimicrobiales bacterium]
MRLTRLLSTAASLAAVLALAGCGGDGDRNDAEDRPADPTGDAAAFPLTIEHAFGETTIEERPERVATVAWMNHEVPLALGVVPVGMAEATWGDDDGDGVLPWVEERLEELGADTPVLFDETEGIDFEAVADTAPDVILASYSGLTQEDYDTLSKIAPVVAYPDVAWGTSVDDMIEMNSKALGLEKEGEALIQQLHADADAALEANAALKGKKVL